MGEKPGTSRGLGEAYGHAALGVTFAAGVVVFTGLGWLLDRWLHLVPLFTILGALVGSVLSFLSVYTRIRRSDETRRQAHRADPP
ncbi:MAG TPA: AtpZ/AtpI family protein [Gemmatimonadales bacterium]